MTWLGAIALVALVVVPLAAGVFIAMVALPRHLVTRPCCGSCGTLLPARAAAGHASCPACGNTRESAPPPVPSQRPARRLALAASLVVVVAFAGLFARSRSEPWLSRLAGMPASPPTDILIAAAVGPSGIIDLPHHVLVARADAGEDTAEIAGKVLEATLAGPVSSQAPASPAAFEIASIAFLGLRDRPRAEPRTSASAASLGQKVLDKLYQRPRVWVAPQEGSSVLVIDAQPALTAPVRIARVLRVTRATVDGNDLDLARAPSLLLVESQTSRLNLPLDPSPSLTPGGDVHSVRVEFEVLLYSRFDAERLRDHHGRLRPRTDWPRPIAVRNEHVEAEVGASPPEPEAPPPRNPRPSLPKKGRAAQSRRFTVRSPSQWPPVSPSAFSHRFSSP